MRSRDAGPPGPKISARDGGKEDQMSAAPRTIQAAPSLRPLAAVFVTILMATALVLALAYGQLSASRGTTAPLNVGAQFAHDHGWSTAPAAGAAPVINDRGWATA